MELKQTYVRDEKTGVWARPDFASIAYSDGDDSETRLAESIAQVNDVSVLSAELRRHCVDWPSLYHLSPTRANILRPFSHALRGRVLEIGAGCGAISRFLGENGGEILSLEGSYRRASIAASRTRDLPNVKVVAERFDDFEGDGSFDAVTLIGVLEYAGMFSDAAAPALHMLRRAWHLLAPGGRLFIAIENQLGLKYFAGAPEDHLGVAMYGVEGRYRTGQPQTFGRQALGRLLREAGFERVEYLVPAPDYKVPNTILTEEGLASKDFDAAALVWENVVKDPQLPEHTHFQLQRAWPVIVRNGLGVDMANSFLICASKGATQSAVPSGTLAFHYTTDRKAEFCREATFVQNGEAIGVRYSPLSDKGLQANAGSSFRLPAEVPYQPGRLLSSEFAAIVSQPGWTCNQVSVFVKRYVRILTRLLQADGCTLASDALDALLPGKFVEATPSKIVVDESGQPHLIAVEWYPDEAVELGYLIVRALIQMLEATNTVLDGAPAERFTFLKECLNPVGWQVTPDLLQRYTQREIQLQAGRREGLASITTMWAPHQSLRGTWNAGLPKSIRAKVYIADERGALSEERARSLTIHPGINTLHFDLADFTPLSRLRFDPVDAECTFRIQGIQLRTGDTLLWEWNQSIGSLEQLSAVAPLVLANDQAALLATDADPHFWIFIPIPPAAPSPVILTVVQELISDTPPEANKPEDIRPALLATDKDELLTEVNEALAQKRLLLEAQSEEICTVQGTMQDTQAELDFLRNGVIDSGHEVKKLQDALESLQAELDQARRELEFKHLTVLNNEANEAETKRMQEALKNANHEIECMREMLAAVDAQSSHMVDQTASHQNLSAEIERLQVLLQEQQVAKDTHIHNLNLQIVALYSSTSWKVTAPLRKVTRLLRRLYKLYTVLPSIIRRGGGVAATSRKAYRVLTTQGIAGLAGRVRWVVGASRHEFVGQETRPVVDRHDYATWVQYYDTMDENKRWLISEVIRGFTRRPKISIIMPVYNPPIALLTEAVESVRAQLYGEWELCIADDASTDPEIARALRTFARQDKRIKVVIRAENGHISHASNSALKLATGEFIALMDNDDLLPEHALYWVARSILENPNAGMFYSDEDKIDATGKRSSPYFKCAWNSHLFRSQNMVCHLGVYRTDLVRELGGFRPGFEGSQDYDLALRCADVLKPAAIVHIPRVLYHWRIHTGSTALAGSEKPYAALAGVKALEEHLQRKHCKASVELLPNGMYRVHYEVPTPQPMVSLIIPTRNAEALVRQCIDSVVQRSTYTNYEIILVDNGSDDPSALAYFGSFQQSDRVRVIRDDSPFNYSALNNMAVREARGEFVCLLNNDIEVVTPNWLEEMVGLAALPEVGAVGARLWYPDDRLQHGGVIVGVGGVAGHSHKYLPKGDYGYFCRAALVQEFSAVTAACLVIRKSTFQAVEGLDEQNLTVAFNDVDFCLRVLEAGYVNVWTPYAELYHHESASRGHEDTPEKQARFSKEIQHMKARWPNIQDDYCYSPNLTLSHEDFSLAWPPRVKI